MSVWNYPVYFPRRGAASCRLGFEPFRAISSIVRCISPTNPTVATCSFFLLSPFLPVGWSAHPTISHPRQRTPPSLRPPAVPTSPRSLLPSPPRFRFSYLFPRLARCAVCTSVHVCRTPAMHRKWTKNGSIAIGERTPCCDCCYFVAPLSRVAHSNIARWKKETLDFGPTMRMPARYVDRIVRFELTEVNDRKSLSYSSQSKSSKHISVSSDGIRHLSSLPTSVKTRKWFVKDICWFYFLSYVRNPKISGSVGSEQPWPVPF